MFRALYAYHQEAELYCNKFLQHTCNVCGRNLITGLTSAASPRVDISSNCKVGQTLGVSLLLFTCSPSAWPTRLLYRIVRKSRRDLWNTLYLSGLSCYCVHWKKVSYFSLCYLPLVGGGSFGLKYVGVIKVFWVFSQQSRIMFVSFFEFVSVEQEILCRHAIFYDSNLCLRGVFNMYCDV